MCSDLLVGGNTAFVIGLAPTMELHFLHSLPGQSWVLMCKWNMALFVHADGPSPWAACKETHPWHSGTILSPLPLLLLLLLPLAFSAISWNEEWAPKRCIPINMVLVPLLLITTDTWFSTPPYRWIKLCCAELKTNHQAEWKPDSDDIWIQGRSCAFDIAA